MSTTVRLIVSAFWLSVALVGCGGNDDPVAPQVGTITINPEPNSISAPWQITGPGGFNLSGSGDSTLGNITAGNYTLTWGAVTGWTTPSPATVTRTLTANGTVAFTGTYVAQAGTITIDPQPNSISAPWQITGPGGFNLSGSGDTTLESMTAGNYTLVWGAVTGWTLPSPATVTQTLTANAPLTFTGTYAVQTGTITINPEPNSISAPWQITGPGGFSLSGNGDTTLGSMTAGGYTLTWGVVTGWTTPDPATVTQTLTGEGALTFTGMYVAQTGTITIDPQPNSISAPWQITGPGGFSLAGNGDTTLGSMTTGSYTLTWGTVIGWTTPDPAAATQILTVDGTLMFTGTYVAQAGTITIDPQPNSISAPWQITGPGGFNQAGSGDITLAAAAVGSYTLTWGAVTGWTTPSPATVTQTLTEGGALTFTGTYVAQAGTITIDPQPNSINAPWQITGPGGFSQAGSGDAAFGDLAAGNYTLIWGAVTGWRTPSPAAVSQTLTVDGTLTFTGIYVAQTGTITINPQPNSINAPWQITGPGGFALSGSADTNLGNMTAGSYTLTWGAVAGWTTPSPATVTQTLTADGAVTFTGTYVVQTGTITIDPQPNSISAPWQITGPGGFSQAGSGDITLAAATVGSYTLTWGAVAGWTTPSPAIVTQTLTEGGTLTFTGTYVIQTGTVAINPEPNSISAPWQITGPGGFNLSGNGDTTLPTVAAGNYALTWGAVGGWTTPSPATITRTLVSGGIATFTGVYREGTGPSDGFVPIPAQTFTMGSPTDEPGHRPDETQHQVTLTHGYFMQSTEVTNQQYVELVQWAYTYGYVTATSTSVRDNLDGSTAELLDLETGDSNIRFSGGAFSCSAPDNPVWEVSWYGAAAYCDWLSIRAGLTRAYDHGTWQCNGGSPYTAAGYRLPTEAEWEHACRAGSTTAFANGPITNPLCSPLDPNLDQIGWYCGNAHDGTGQIAQKDPNDWGLYDMHGNVWEWCNDWYVTYGGAAINPVGPGTGVSRVIRGGYGGNYAKYCRCASRNSVGPAESDNFEGFRPVKSAD